MASQQQPSYNSYTLQSVVAGYHIYMGHLPRKVAQRVRRTGKSHTTSESGTAELSHFILSHF